MCEKSIKIVILFVVLSVLSVTFQGCNKSKKSLQLLLRIPKILFLQIMIQ